MVRCCVCQLKRPFQQLDGCFQRFLVEALLGLRGGGRANGRVEANQPFSSVKPAPAACPTCAVVHHQIAELSNLSGKYNQGYAYRTSNNKQQ